MHTVLTIPSWGSLPAPTEHPCRAPALPIHGYYRARQYRARQRHGISHTNLASGTHKSVVLRPWGRRAALALSLALSGRSAVTFIVDGTS